MRGAIIRKRRRKREVREDPVRGFRPTRFERDLCEVLRQLGNTDPAPPASAIRR